MDDLDLNLEVLSYDISADYTDGRAPRATRLIISGRLNIKFDNKVALCGQFTYTSEHAKLRYFGIDFTDQNLAKVVSIQLRKDIKLAIKEFMLREISNLPELC